MATDDVIAERSLEEPQTLEELRRRERELADFVENASVGLHWVGADGTILWANQAELDLLGYSRDEYVGRGISEFHDDQGVISDILRRLTGGETLHNYEARLRCKDGSVRHVLINSNVLWDGDKFVHTRCFTRDITERKRAEEELLESKARLEELLAREQSARAEAKRGRDFTRLVVDDAPIAVGVLEGPNHRFMLVNRQTCESTGLSREQLIGRTHAEAVPGADKVVGPILDRVYASGRGETQEIEVDLPRGRRQFLVTWTALPGADGRPGSVLYLSLDITARKRAEEALRANEEQFRAVAETAPDAIITIDAESTILFANQSTQKIFGHALEDLRGRPLELLMPEYLRHLHRAGVKRYVETGRKHINWDAVEVMGLHRDGHEVPLEISFSEFVTRGERRFTGIIRDITERRRAQAALTESERQLRILADAVPQLVWMADADGSVFWYNQRWYDYTGTTPEQMEGWGWQSVHDPEMLPRVVERWKASLATGDPFEMEFPLKGADGAFRWFLTRVNPLRDSQGRIVRWFGTNTDVDEQRRTAEELREANRLKDEFLATVSHELRTPLTAILGWSHLLRTGTCDETVAATALETIERNARSQSQLIDDLLDVSRIITGNLRLDVRQVDPASIIESAIEALRPAAEAKSVRMQKVMDTGVISVAGDPARLQQIIWNLLSNAIKFTPKGGRVQVRLERINSHIEIAISDTGAGIDREFLPHVFERFRQADQKSTRRHGGLGLGLAIVRHLVELHGGTVEADSAGPGLGAIFVVKLPVVPVYQMDELLAERVHPAARETLPSYDCAERLDGLKVLVVDDEVDTREVLRAGIARCGAEVVTVGTARAALDAVEEGWPDLLISDIGMPGEDGYELIKKIRGLPAGLGGRIPAIALTAYARTEDRLRALRSGYQMHISKPVELAELVAVMASLVRRDDNAQWGPPSS